MGLYLSLLASAGRTLTALVPQVTTIADLGNKESPCPELVLQRAVLWPSPHLGPGDSLSKQPKAGSQGLYPSAHILRPVIAKEELFCIWWGWGVVGDRQTWNSQPEHKDGAGQEENGQGLLWASFSRTQA